MDKDEFIIQCAISNMNGQFPSAEKARNARVAIDYAERLWDELARREYVQEESELKPSA